MAVRPLVSCSYLYWYINGRRWPVTVCYGALVGSIAGHGLAALRIGWTAVSKETVVVESEEGKKKKWYSCWISSFSYQIWCFFKELIGYAICWVSLHLPFSFTGLRPSFFVTQAAVDRWKGNGRKKSMYIPLQTPNRIILLAERGALLIQIRQHRSIIAIRSDVEPSHRKDKNWQMIMIANQKPEETVLYELIFTWLWIELSAITKCWY